MNYDDLLKQGFWGKVALGFIPSMAAMYAATKLMTPHGRQDISNLFNKQIIPFGKKAYVQHVKPVENWIYDKTTGTG